jgi:hypothetical protein
MKALFLCGSLEVGKDGVGDYSRRLATKLTHNGHQTWVMALNDQYIKEQIEEDQSDDGVSVKVLRLSHQLPLAHKIAFAHQWIQKIGPDWISLQYVPYAFHPQGLPFFWIRQFKSLDSNARWHIMMHELWIGSEKQDSLKEKLIGVLQRYTVKKTINSVNPAAITTSIPYYHTLLQSIGRVASILPVFSNVPLGNKANTYLYNQLPIEVQDNRSNWYITALFGSVHPFIGIEANIETLRLKAQAENKKLLITHVGRASSISTFFEQAKAQASCEYLVFGEQEAMDIASFFQHIDFGLSTYNDVLLSKSGSVAAMLYNQLPVILLKESSAPLEDQPAYTRFVDNIPTLRGFCNQDKHWSELYSIENAASFYQNLFK